MPARWAAAGAVWVLMLAGAGPAGAGTVLVTPRTCYLVAAVEAADGRGPGGSLTRLTLTGATAADEVGVDGDAVSGIDTVALQPGTGVPFVTAGGTLGKVDIAAGRIDPVGALGAGSGRLGAVEFDDLGGLAFDATSGALYGIQRWLAGEDLLVRIDPGRGAVVPAAMAGFDYAVVSGLSALADVEEIAVDPGDGQMYAVVKDRGESRLVRLDKTTGQATPVAGFGTVGIHGLAFAEGQLIGIAHDEDGTAGIWDIDRSTAALDNLRPLEEGREYGPIDCLAGPSIPTLAAPAEPAGPAVSAGPAPMADPGVRAPSASEDAAPAPAAPAAPALAVAGPAPVAAAELPRTGWGTTALVSIAGVGLTFGGLAVMPGGRRRERLFDRGR